MLPVVAGYIGKILKRLGKFIIDIAVSQRIAFGCGRFEREVIVESETM